MIRESVHTSQTETAVVLAKSGGEGRCGQSRCRREADSGVGDVREAWIVWLCAAASHALDLQRHSHDLVLFAQVRVPGLLETGVAAGAFR